MADKTFIKQTTPSLGVWTDVYISSAYGQVGNITVTNTNTTGVNYYLAFSPAGAAIAAGHYIVPNEFLEPYGYKVFDEPRWVSATDVVRVCCTSSGVNITAHIFET